MKTFKTSSFLLIICLFSISISCSKNEDFDKLRLATTQAKDITDISAVIGGKIITNADTAITACGVCWSTSKNPTLADSSKSCSVDSIEFESTIIGLHLGTTYYARAYATNHLGTAYGNQITFKTLLGVTDIDGNIYHSVSIGTQIWMVENLKTTKYRDGTSIPNVTSDLQWSGCTTGAYCNYNNNVNNVKVYGRLYNWYAVNNSKNLAPTGWHVPTYEDWNIMIKFLGDYEIAGEKIKEAGTTHWKSSNANTTNSTGFTALPAGRRGFYFDGFEDLGSIGYWWTTMENPDYGFALNLSISEYGSISSNFDFESYGLSVRCVKDK